MRLLHRRQTAAVLRRKFLPCPLHPTTAASKNSHPLRRECTLVGRCHLDPRIVFSFVSWTDLRRGNVGSSLFQLQFCGNYFLKSTCGLENASLAARQSWGAEGQGSDDVVVHWLSPPSLDDELIVADYISRSPFSLRGPSRYSPHRASGPIVKLPPSICLLLTSSLANIEIDSNFRPRWRIHNHTIRRRSAA